MPVTHSTLYTRILFRGLPVFFAGMIWLVALPCARGTVLDWPNPPGWTGGTPAPGQTVTQSFTAVVPNDVTVAINNNGANAVGASWSAGYPAINSSLINGGMPGTNGLQLLLTAESSTSSYVQLTVTFLQPVANLSFQIWDVDSSSQYIDTISQIQGLAVGGGLVGADSITSAVSGFNTISGSGLGTVVTGTTTASNTSNQGTIDITFLQPITQFSFRYSNADSSLGAQGIALGPLTFAVVPESVPPWASAGLALCAIAVSHIRRRR